MAGCLFGFLLIRPTGDGPVFASWLPDSRLLIVLFIPGIIGEIIAGYFISAICFLSDLLDRDWCASVTFLFDGGSLEWIEWIFFYVFTMAGWGFIFLAFYKLFVFLREKIRKE